MLTETQSKRNSRSVIARLMGLDGLPPRQPSHKKKSRSSENYMRKTLSTEKAQRNSTSCSHRSSRKTLKGEQDLKDVFELSDASEIGWSRYSLRRTANSVVTEDEIASMQHKFMDAKLLLTDEELQDSKEFRGTIDDLDSNKDLLLKFLQQPDSLFTKHLHDLHGAPLQSHCSHITAMKSTYAPEFESGRPGCKIERETQSKNRRKTSDDFVSPSYSKHDTHSKSSKISLDRKDESALLPTKIVVLKPHLGKMQNSTRTASSPLYHDFISDCGNHTELPSIKSQEERSCANKKFPNDLGSSRYKSGESRELARKITRQMRNSFGSGSKNFSGSGFRGYAGDESSPNRSESESANESKIAAVTSRNSIDWGNHYRKSSSRSTESSVSREARKRLSERWKMTHNSVDMGVVSRGTRTTLGEMLAIPYRDVKPTTPDVMISDKFDVNDGLAVWVEPLGISSRDGWIKNLLRSESGSASSTAVNSPKMGHWDISFEDKYMMPKQVAQRERNNTLTGNLNQREGSSSRISGRHTKKSHTTRCSYSADHSDTSPEIHLSLHQVQHNITEDNLSEHNHVDPDTMTSIVTEKNLGCENMMDVAIEDMVMPQPIDQELSAYLLVKEDSSTSGPHVLSTQDPSNGQLEKGSVSIQPSITELESRPNSKEADQPSPVSVLGTPFPDDLSSGSECFESLNADLHGLRMQLHLLKLESETYAEGSIFISSDEDVDNSLVGFSGKIGMAEESRESSYIVDVLLHCGINAADPDTFISTWYCSERPVHPKVFDDLEKKYSNHASWPRSGRRLLFDRVNSGLSLIYRRHANPHPWVRPASGIGPKWIKNGLQDWLHEALASEDKEVEKDAAEVLVGETLWLDMGDDVDIIGREIESLLTDELVKELVAM